MATSDAEMLLPEAAPQSLGLRGNVWKGVWALTVVCMCASLLMYLAGFLDQARLQPRELLREDRSVVGILTMEHHYTGREFERLGHTIIYASYVKWLERAGAHVVPVHFDLSGDEFLDQLDHIDAILLPGGADPIEKEGTLTPWAKQTALVYRYALGQHRQGIHFPVWGTCLGFEAGAVALNDGEDKRFRILAQEGMAPLRIEPGAESARVLRGDGRPEHLLRRLEDVDDPPAAFFHVFAVPPSAYEGESPLASLFRVVATVTDSNGTRFVSIVEGRDGLPIWGSQFHPEKNELVSKTLISHTNRSIEVGRYFGHFFVGEARRASAFRREEAQASEFLHGLKPRKSHTPIPPKWPNPSRTPFFFDEAA